MQIGQVGPTSADFQAWLDAVDAALKSLSRGFNVSMIDHNTAFAAFQAGASPVVYARNVQPNPTPPPVAYPQANSSPAIAPNRTIIRWTYVFLNVAGWAFWAIGAVATVIAVVLLLIGLVSGNAGVAGVAIMGAVANLFTAVGIFVSGSLWHYMAQKLAIAWVDCRAYTP